MSSAQFDVDQSLLDTLNSGFSKREFENSVLDDTQAANLFSIPEFPAPGTDDLSDFNSLFTQNDNINVNEQHYLNGITPSLDSEETPGSTESVSLSPKSPLSSSTNVYNPTFAFGNQTAGNSTDDINGLGVNAGVEKRKASVAPISDSKKPAKSAKATPRAKPGRKAETSEPANKKKAQNRAAQRAFRERKERHLKELEDRVAELETESQATNTENEFLKQQVERLQAELKKYRSSRGSQSSIPLSSSGNSTSNSQFTFEFPFFQRSQQSQGRNSSSPQSNSIDSSPSSLISPNSGIGSVSSASSSHSPNEKSCASSHEPAEDTFCEQLNLACGTKENPVPSAPAMTKGETPLIISALQNSHNEAAQTPFSTKSSVSADVISPPIFELDFLSEYRDPIFDNEDFTLPDLTTENSMFDPLTTDVNNKYPLYSRPEAPLAQKEETVPANPTKLMTCTAVWDRISQHPKFGDLDIDGLCAELRTKAKCSESGVVLSEKDVNNVLNTLNNV